MRGVILIAALLSPVLPAFGSVCVSGTLQDYIGLGSGGCQIGAASFTNFVTVPGQFGATAIDPSLVLISPTGPDLLITLNTTAGAGSLLEAIFRFSAAGQFGGAGIALGGSSATDDGVATAILDVCADGSFAGDAPSGCPAGGLTAIALVADGFSQLSDSFASPASFFDVFVDLTADGGLAGAAEFGTATVSLSQVPEPSSTWILGAALPLLGWLSRRASR